MTVVFHAALFDAQVTEQRINSIRLAHNGGPIEARGRVFVDGTGDALLAAAAGADFVVGDDAGMVMPLTTMFAVGGVDTALLPTSDEVATLARVGPFG